MQLVIAAPGRLQHPAAQAWAEDYLGRIARIVPVSRLTGREAKRRKGGVDRQARHRESAALLAGLPPGALKVALDVGGREMDSDTFLAWLRGCIEMGGPAIAFVIGGPDGHDPDVLAACDLALSISPMVLPHELAEVVLLEQLYRALTRWKGLPYHR